MSDSSEISESELSQFKGKKSSIFENVNADSEEILIRKYVTGECAFPAYYTTFDEEDDDIKPAAQHVLTTSQLEPTTSTEEPKKKEKRTFRRRTLLNPALQGLMGEANLCFVRGQVEMTEKICLEIIRQNPLAAEPFFTLAQLYETKDSEKFLNFSTIAAHLDPSNRDQWIRIAEINIERTNLPQARIYYSKAIKHLPKDYDLRLRKAKLLELMGEHREAMLTYLKMIPFVPPEEGSLCLETAKTVASHFCQSQKLNLALEAMRGAYLNCPNLFTTEDVNLLLELLIINKNYDTVLMILQDRYENLKVCLDNKDGKVEVINCVVPKNCIPDFRSKLCVCLIHLKAFHLLNYLLKEFNAHVRSDDGIEWFMDVVEALMKENKFNEAINLLKPIIDNETAPPYVWLRNAECYRSLDMIEEAIKSYYEVIEVAPFCYEAKFTLSALLKQQGRHREAIRVLERDTDDNTVINPRLFYERCLMLKAVGELEQFIDVGYILLARNSIKFRTRDEVLLCSNGGYQYKSDTLKSIVESRLVEDESPVEVDQNGNDVSAEDEYELFKDIAQTSFELRKYGKLEKLCFAVLTAKRFLDKSEEMLKIMLFSSLYNNDCLVTFNFFREILPKHYESMTYWNFMNVIIQKSDDTRYFRYLKRLFSKHPNHLEYLNILLGHYHLVAGSYKYALNIYVPLYKEFKHPLTVFCTAISLSQISLQKNNTKKTTGIGQAIGFINLYKKLRMNPSTKQEILYNLGRLHHQSGVINVALHYYQQALEVVDPLIEENSDILSLNEEIAFNMHLIYKASGNLQMARQMLFKHINI